MELMARLYLSFDVNHFEIEELSFLTLWWDFRKEPSFWHRFRLLILTRLAVIALDSCAKLLAVLHISSAQGRSVPHLCRVFIERGLPTTAYRGLQIIPSQSSHQKKILMHLHLIEILRALMNPISVSFPVHPRPDRAAPVKDITSHP